MKKISILLLIILLSISLNAQINEMKDIAKNNIFIQFDIMQSISLKYERQILTLNKTVLNINVGISHTVPNYNSFGYKWYGIPFELLMLSGKRRSHFEFGLGYWYRKSYHKLEDIHIENNYQIKIGYRFQNLSKNGINFRIGLAPTYSTQWDIDYLSTDFHGYWYLTVGYHF